MASAAYELRYLQEALDSLESYLLADELFWNLPASPPPGEPAFPALTPGGILLSQARLAALTLSAAEESQLQSLSMQVEAVRLRWRSAWENKALRGLKSRLAQWANFLEDYRSDPDAHASRYAYEVRLRLMLDLLAAELPEIPNEQIQLWSSLDLILEHVLVENGFIWEEVYAAGFPRDKYWYLYGTLRTEIKDY